jgi:hypothetical protein
MRWTKRAFDLCCAVLGLLVLLELTRFRGLFLFKPQPLLSF